MSLSSYTSAVGANSAKSPEDASGLTRYGAGDETRNVGAVGPVGAVGAVADDFARYRAGANSADNVIPYYQAGGVDTLDYLHAKLSDQGYEAFLVGMVHKKLHKAFHGAPAGRYGAYQKAAGYMARLLDLRGRAAPATANPIPNFGSLGLRTPAPSGAAPADFQSAAPAAAAGQGTQSDAQQFAAAGQGYNSRAAA